MVNQPIGNGSSGDGANEAERNRTVVSNGASFAIGAAGVTTSSSPRTTHFASLPATWTAATDLPSKSRLKLDSGCEARADIVTLPMTSSPGVPAGYVRRTS